MGLLREFGVLQSVIDSIPDESCMIITPEDDQVMTMDNFVETDMDVTMLRGIAIETLEITASSYVVGNIAAHTFTFDTPIPLLPEN